MPKLPLLHLCSLWHWSRRPELRLSPQNVQHPGYLPVSLQGHRSCFPLWKGAGKTVHSAPIKGCTPKTYWAKNNPPFSTVEILFILKAGPMSTLIILIRCNWCCKSFLSLKQLFLTPINTVNSPRILHTVSQFWEISFNHLLTFTNDSGFVTS